MAASFAYSTYSI